MNKPHAFKHTWTGYKHTVKSTVRSLTMRFVFPDTFVFKTLAIETNLCGFLVEFQDFISQKVVKNVIEPPSTRQTL